LRSLERTGEVRLAAKDAGIHYSTAYGRRQAHGEFAEAWARALAAHSEAKKLAEREEVRRFSKALDASWDSPAPLASSAGGRGGEEVEFSASGGQMKRVNRARWNKAAEARFFATLAATANVEAAAEAAGFSTTAIYARRLRHLAFREQWAAAVDSARARLELHVLETANEAFEKGAANVGSARMQVGIADALHILKLGAEPRPAASGSSRRAGRRGGASDGIASDAEVRAALVKSLKAFGVRVSREDLLGQSKRCGDGAGESPGD
jgi:hypothetical protein